MPGTVIKLFPNMNREHEVEMLCAVCMSQHGRLGRDSPLRLFAVKAVSHGGQSKKTKPTVFTEIVRLVRCYTIEIDRGKPSLHPRDAGALVCLQKDVKLLRSVSLSDMSDLFEHWDGVETNLSGHDIVHGIDSLADPSHGFPMTFRLIMKVLIGMTTTPGTTWLGCDMTMLTYVLLLLYQSISTPRLQEATEVDAIMLSRIVRLCMRQLGACMDTRVSLWACESSHTYRARLLMRTLMKFAACFQDDCKFCDVLFCMTEPIDVPTTPGIAWLECCDSDGNLLPTHLHDRGMVYEMLDLVHALFECDFSVDDFVCTCLRELYIHALKHGFSVVDLIAFVFYAEYSNLPPHIEHNGVVFDLGKNLLQSLFAHWLVQDGFETRVKAFMLIACVLFPMRVLGDGQAFTLLPHCVFSPSVFVTKTKQALRFDDVRTYARVELELHKLCLQIYSHQSAKPEVFANYNGLVFGLPPTAELRHAMPSMLLQSIGQLKNLLEASRVHADESRA